MADKIQRQTQKIFAEKATTDSLAVFGSMITGNPIYTDNIEDLQSNAYQEGWVSAIAANEAPFLEEMNGVQYGLSKQIAYTLQTGMPEWDTNTEYFANTSFCQVDGVWYQSLTDNNVGNNPVDDSTNWKKVDFSSGSAGSGTSLPLFSPVLQDHILSFEESKGYALQGTYVYKESAPERYGYPDFYAKCLNEYKDASNIKNSLKDNIVKVGNLNTNNGVLSGFSNNAYALLPKPLAPNSSPWELVIKFNFDSRPASTSTYIVGGSDSNKPNFHIAIASDGLLIVDIGDGTNWQHQLKSLTTLEPGTNYWVKTEYNGEKYTASLSQDGKNFIKEAEFDSSIPIGNMTKSILGNSRNIDAYFTGFIDLKESYINVAGERFWSGSVTAYNNPNGHQYYNISNKEYIDELFQTNGMAWLYGIDEANERIFMPRKKLYKDMPKTEIPVVGNGKVLGFSDGTVTYGIIGYAGNIGAVTRTFDASNPPTIGAAASGSNPTSNKFGGVSSSSEVSGLIAETGTLFEEDTTRWLYICVGNTEAEVSAVEVTEITTSENDTVPLFTGHYFDFTPNNPSWLKAGEQANSGGVYTSAYNILVNELTAAKYGLKVIETSAMEADVDYSEYWKVNQEKMWFVTPTELSYKASTAQLYFKVANAVQNLELLDVGEVSEALSEKIGRQDCKSYITETYQNGASWYRVYSDGWCEQGGLLDPTSTANSFKSVSLLKTYESSSYSAIATNCGGTGNATPYVVKVGNSNVNTPNTLQISCNNSNTGVNWRTCGYLAAKGEN